jgi:hypothetical protein
MYAEWEHTLSHPSRKGRKRETKGMEEGGKEKEEEGEEEGDIERVCDCGCACVRPSSCASHV